MKEKQYKNTGHDLSDLAQKAIDKIFDKFQPTPTDAPPITTEELINGLENMPDFSGRNTNAHGEVMNPKEWFESAHPKEDVRDWDHNYVMSEYAHYYHATLSQQPEQKADGMSADKVVDWEKIKEEYIARWSDETSMPNEYNTFMWFKSRLSTSGVSDGEKVRKDNEFLVKEIRRLWEVIIPRLSDTELAELLIERLKPYSTK